MATGAVLLLLPSAGEGQLVVGTDATWIHRSEETVPRGPGMQVWGSFGLSDWVRVTGAVSQEWGRKDVRDSETGRLTFESKGKLESRRVGLELVSPPFLGARLSAGLHLSHHDLSTQSITYWEFDGVRERSELYEALPP